MSLIDNLLCYANARCRMLLLQISDAPFYELGNGFTGCFIIKFALEVFA